tara:strand:+ start:1656 stop:2285 length:630 start_codon:yes stop_codon:yes gene_type:complete
MKKIVFLLFFVPFLTKSQSFSNGWQEGYKKGYCDNDFGCIEPIPPISPIAPIKSNFNLSDYQHGYNEGFKAGMKAKVGKSNSSSSNLTNTMNQLSQQRHEQHMQQMDHYNQMERESQRQMNENMRNLADAMAKQRAENMGWKKISDVRFTYTYVGASGFARLKKLEKKALDEVENESIRKGFEYEIIKIFRHKQSFGILPKVEVLIEIQ